MPNLVKDIKIYRYINNIISRYIVKNAKKRNTLLYENINKNKLYHLRIARGCNSNCSFCKIKKSIGPLRSKSIEECINELKFNLENGNSDFLLLAEDVGSYGLDIGSNLPELLNNIIQVPGKFSLSFSGISTMWLVKYIDDLEKILKSKKIVLINVSLKSGSSRILKLMNQFSNIERIKSSIQKLKKAYPNIELEAQIFVGFPTETDNDLKDTLNLIVKIGFDYCYVFRNKNLRGTAAYNLRPHISKSKIFKKIVYSKKFFEKNGYEIIFDKRRVFIAKLHKKIENV